MIEKTRKYLVKKLPELGGLNKICYERYFLFINNEVELRIQRKNDLYELERIVQLKNNETDKTKIKITKDEFDVLKIGSIGKIERESYVIQENPEIIIRFYRGEYDGLVRAETEQNVVPEWFGKEITETDLGRDRRLVKLNRNDFLNLLNEFLL